ncbi:MAG: gamma carbonic anhydrase family protein [Dethiobacteria bacterium]|jgi:carbonic anhydrase/acetyltransferase-like protein (isoleucine patch superfamily)|nr:gamma carbonic anhydrase family protein [Bacillota bacterium]
MLYAIGDLKPVISEDVFIAPGARIIGQVTIKSQSSVWYNAVIRGDIDAVYIGAATNVQDNCTIHEDKGYPVMIGDRVSVAHGSVLHGCTVEDDALIGMGCCVLTGAYIGEGAIIGANSLVTGKTRIPPYTLALGSPAKPVRELTEKDLEEARLIFNIYRERAAYYRKNMSRLNHS